MGVDKKFPSGDLSTSGYFHKNLEPSLREILTRDPQLLFERNICDFKLERRSRVSLIDFAGKRYIVKHYFIKNFFFWLRRLVLPSFALNIRKRVSIMEQHHISTPLLLAAVDYGKGFFYRGTTCLYEYVAPNKNKDLLMEELADKEKRGKIIFSYISLLGRMHKAGIYHGDAKISNFLWVEHSGDVDIHVIDLDDCRVEQNLAMKQRAYDLANLIFSLAWRNSDLTLMTECFDAYMRYDSSWCGNKLEFLDRLKERIAHKLEHREQRQKK